MPPETYAEVVDRQARERANARLNDPNEHFPYKYDEVMQLLADDPNMGPGTPGGDDGASDDSRTAADYMSEGIAAASRDYIDAQAAWLTGPSEATKSAYEAARDRLVAARLDHRQNRESGFTVGGAARRGR